MATALGVALSELQRNFDLLGSDLGTSRPDLQRTFRTATVKSFEFVYELSVKLVRRALKSRVDAPGLIDELDFRALMRLAGEKGLVHDPVAWFEFREKRNITSHTYDAVLADAVVAAIPQLMERARFVLRCLEDANAHSKT